MQNPFTRHPHSIGEGYFEHLIFACRISGNLLWGGFAFFIHALFPFLFEKTGSNILFRMMQKFIHRMPNVNESRVENLCQMIDQKKKVNV